MNADRDAGYYLVAIGDPARAAARRCLMTLREAGNGLPVRVVTDGPLVVPGGVQVDRVDAQDPSVGWGARGAKLDALARTAWSTVIYLDADLTVRGYLDPLADLVGGDGPDLALTVSTLQGADLLGNIDPEERAATLTAALAPLGYQAGLFAITRNDRTLALMAAWRAEWQRWGRHDQAALLRAFRTAPVRLWLLGRPFNAPASAIGPTTVVGHHFGDAVRTRRGVWRLAEDDDERGGRHGRLSSGRR